MAGDSTVVAWREDGTPVSPRFDDIYRNAGADGRGGLAQARHVFLRGCGLLRENGQPAAWAGTRRWRILETGFGLGLNFLATWAAWRADPQRPRFLFHTAVEAWPPAAEDLLRSAAAWPELTPLARELVDQWHGLVPGFHRLRFEDERVLLTLVVGDVGTALARIGTRHDSLFLDGFSPERNPAMWSLQTLKGTARLLRPGARAATWCVAHAVRERLAHCGFAVQRVPGLPPKRHALRAIFRPRWATGAAASSDHDRLPPGHCVVIGAGLAGSAAAWSLARHGWRVTVLDRAAQPAAGASAVPAGIFAPHITPDDDLLAQFTRAGIRATRTRAVRLLRPDIDYAAHGVLELHAPGKRRLPPAWTSSRAATAGESCNQDDAEARRQFAAIDGPDGPGRPALWHQRGGWMRPAALVHALLSADGIRFQGGVQVARLEQTTSGWRVLDAAGNTAACTDLIVLATAHATARLLPNGELPLRPLAGQVAFGTASDQRLRATLPDFPVNGHGYLVHPASAESEIGWLVGSTFERDKTMPVQTAGAHADNLAQLRALLPHAADVLAAQWRCGRARAWAGVRATLPDHLPAVGAWREDASMARNPRRGRWPPPQPARLYPLQLCTGMGARGISFAVLCGEILVAQLHDEPLPISRQLADHVLASRFQHPRKSEAAF